MSGTARIWFVIPAYNEAGSDTIATTVRGVKATYENIVVVDDHSHDETAELALGAGAHVCSHPINLGQGAALATGIEYALKQGATAIVTFDADGQHRVEDATRMLQRLDRGDVDVLLGSRFVDDGAAPNMPPLRRVVLRLATLFTRATTGLKVTDTHNGLRALSRHAAEVITIKQDRMAHASEILHEIGRHRLRYEEMPTMVLYTAYSKQKGQKLSGAFAILADLLMWRLRR